MICTWKDKLVAGGVSIRTSLTQAEADKLAELAKDKSVLEIGSAFGFSAITMALGGASVTSIDPHCEWAENSLEVMHENLQAAGVDHQVTMIRGFSHDVMPALNVAYDLVFIDGNHSEQAVVTDLMWAALRLRPGGTLVCHDYGEDTCPGVKAALDMRFPMGPDELVDTLWIKYR